jgi:hypothetical protein
MPLQRALGAVDAEQRRVGRLVGGGVLPRRLAELMRRAFDVEDVVDDLEHEAEVGGARSIASRGGRRRRP